MFMGLGAMELLLLAGIVLLAFGPRTLGKAVRMARKVNDAKREFSPAKLVERVLTGDEKKSSAKKRGESAEDDT